MVNSSGGPTTRRASARIAARQSQEPETPKLPETTPSRRTRAAATPIHTPVAVKTIGSRERGKGSVELSETPSNRRTPRNASKSDAVEDRPTPRTTRSRTASNSSTTGLTPSPSRRSSRLTPKLNAIPEDTETRRLSFNNTEKNGDSDSDVMIIDEITPPVKAASTVSKKNEKNDESNDDETTPVSTRPLRSSVKVSEKPVVASGKKTPKSAVKETVANVAEIQGTPRVTRNRTASQTSVTGVSPSPTRRSTRLTKVNETAEELPTTRLSFSNVESNKKPDSDVDVINEVVEKSPPKSPKKNVKDAEKTDETPTKESSQRVTRSQNNSVVNSPEKQPSSPQKPVLPDGVESSPAKATRSRTSSASVSPVKPLSAVQNPKTPTPVKPLEYVAVKALAKSSGFKSSPAIERLKKTFWQQSPLNDSKVDIEPMEVDSPSVFGAPKKLNLASGDSDSDEIIDIASDDSGDEAEETVIAVKTPTPNSPRKSINGDKDAVNAVEKPATPIKSPKTTVITLDDDDEEDDDDDEEEETEIVSSTLNKTATPTKSNKVVAIDSEEETETIPIANSGKSPKLPEIKLTNGLSDSDDTEDEDAVMVDSEDDVSVDEKQSEAKTTQENGATAPTPLAKTDLGRLVFLDQASSEEEPESEVEEVKSTTPVKRLTKKRKSVEAKKVTVAPFAFPEMPSVDDFFQSRGTRSAEFVSLLQQSYKDLASLNLFNCDLPEELLLKEGDLEFTWQQVAEQNRAFFKSSKRFSRLLDQEIVLPGDDESADEDAEELGDEEDEDDFSGEDEFDDEDVDMEASSKSKGVDLFSLKESDLANLDAKLKALDNDDLSDDSGDETVGRAKDASEKRKKPAKKSVVDDDFFNLEEMENFVDEQERMDEPDVTDEDDNDDFETDFRYDDFFTADKASEKKKGPSKKVRFAETDDVAEEDDKMEVDEPVLIGGQEDKPAELTTHQRSRDRVMAQIDKLQEENLNPRTWELSGEVHAVDRETNSLLEKYIEADFRQKQPPVNGQEKSDKIYNLCLRRLKDKLFDDVERKYRDDDSLTPYRNLTIDLNDRKSLTAVYEDKYRQQVNGETGDTDDVDPEVKEIHVDMLKLFDNLDALCHLQFVPSRVTEEIKVVKNVSAMRSEEVGPMAAVSANEALLAPEEVARHINAAPLAKEERTKTDKLRERRKKKHKQRDMAAAGKMPKMGKAKEEDAAVAKSLAAPKQSKGADFFKQLQATTLREVKQKHENLTNGNEKKKLKKKKADRSETAAKYKA